MSTPITLTGAYTCTHHNDKQRTTCPVCLVAALTAERDAAITRAERAEASLAAATEECTDVRLKWHAVMGMCAAKEDSIMEADEELVCLRAEVERLKTCGITELAAINPSVLEYCKHWEARAESAERDLAAERARLDYLLQWDVTFHDRADIDAELSYGQRKKSTPTLP